MFDDVEVISAYPLKQAIADGVVVEVFKPRWEELTGGKPLVATRGVYKEFSLAALREIWNEFVECGRPKKLTEKQVDMLKQLAEDLDHSVDEICQTLGISR